jgi:vacuolar protein sorting-associated protein VTA1
MKTHFWMKLLHMHTASNLHYKRLQRRRGKWRQTRLHGGRHTLLGHCEILTLCRGTADTFLASSTFFDMLTIWRKDPESEINSKGKFAKYHAMRILKAFKANEDPNLSNPVKEEAPQAALPPVLDPNDPEVQRINQGGSQTPFQNPFQPYVESAPNTSVQPSPAFSASRISPPPHNLPSAPTGYSQHTSFPSHRDVSPISQPDVSRNGSVASIGGGYFPRVEVPTFTADTAVSSLPTALSIDDDQTMTSPYQTQTPQVPQPQDPRNFYQNPVSPPPIQQPSHQPPHQQAFQPQQPQFISPLPPQFTQQPQPQPPQVFQPNPQPPQQQYQYPPQSPQPAHPQPPAQHYAPAPQSLHQGSFNTDEGSVLEAQKHAKWAISALNFDDVNTAVKELRVALKALGAN